MPEAPHGSARHEAERLVATLLAVASQAARAAGGDRRASGGWGFLGDALLGAADRAHPGAPSSPGAGAASGWATGSAECCVCPVCRVISAMRDPSPEVAERLATGAGDFAAGVASLLRSLSDARPAGHHAPHADPADARAADSDPAAPGAADSDPAAPGAADSGLDASDAADSGPEAPDPADAGPDDAATAGPSPAGRAAGRADDAVWRTATRADRRPTTPEPPGPSRGADVWATATAPTSPAAGATGTGRTGAGTAGAVGDTASPSDHDPPGDGIDA